MTARTHPSGWLGPENLVGTRTFTSAEPRGGVGLGET